MTDDCDNGKDNKSDALSLPMTASNSVIGMGFCHS